MWQCLRISASTGQQRKEFTNYLVAVVVIMSSIQRSSTFLIWSVDHVLIWVIDHGKSRIILCDWLICNPGVGNIQPTSKNTHHGCFYSEASRRRPWCRRTSSIGHKRTWIAQNCCSECPTGPQSCLLEHPLQTYGLLLVLQLPAPLAWGAWGTWGEALQNVG